MSFSLNKSKKKEISENFWKFEHIIGKEFTLIALDCLIRESIENERNILNYLRKLLEKSGISSYVIVSSITKLDPTELKKLGLTEYYIKYDSNWYENIVIPYREKGYIVENTIAFGSTFYQIIKTGTDLTVMDMYYPFLENYIYIGHGFENDLGMFDHIKVKDMFIWPQFSIEDIFIPGNHLGSSQIELGSWKMNFMISVFKKIHNHEYRLPLNMKPCYLHEVSGYENLKEFFKSHMNYKSVAFDTETSGFDFMNDYIRSIQFAFDEENGYFIEWNELKENPDLIKLMSDMLLSIPNRITQNGKFDIKFLWQNGISEDVDVTEDAMEAAHVLCSSRKKGLKTQTYYYTPYGGYDYQLDHYISIQKKINHVSDMSYATLPKKVLFPYATMDPIMTFRTYTATVNALNEFNERFPTEKPISHTGGHAYTPYEWYKNYVMELYKVICHMEYEGIYFDEEVMNKHKHILEEWQEEDKVKLRQIFKDEYHINVPDDFNFSSQLQLGKLLKEAGWKCYGIAANGESYKTDDAAFTEWQRDNMKGVSELIHLRQSVNGIRTYIGSEEKSVDQKKGIIKEEKTGWLQFMKKHSDGTNRIHCNFGVCLNETFRCRSSEPNFQNIPTRGKIAPLVKQCLTVPPADMYYITGESGKTYEVAEVEYVHVKDHPSGQKYIEVRFLTENDTIDETEPVVLDFENGSKMVS